MDEDLVVQAMRSVFSVRQAFSEQTFYKGGLPARQEVDTPTGKIYVGGYWGSAFCFHEDGILVTCEHVRQDTHKTHGGHNPAFVVVCPYEGGGAELNWQHSWRAEFVAHTGITDPAYPNAVLENPPLPQGMVLPDKIDLAILRLVAPVAGTPLTKPPPLRFSRNDPVPMQECWVLGYPLAGGNTPTPVALKFSFKNGNALKVTGAQIMPGHSGGPLVTKSGTVVGWNFGRNDELSWCRQIAAAEKCIRLVLTAPDAWERLLASPSVGWWTRLLDKAECSAKLYPQILAEETVPQTLESVGLCVGDRIVVEVTISPWIFSAAEWPARLQRTTEVRWDAKPSVSSKYANETEGNVRFVLTPQGPRLYDEDEKLYYKWRRSAPDDSAGSAEVDEVQSAGGSLLNRLWARGLLLLLAVGTLFVGYVACRLLLMHCIVPLLNQPKLLSLLLAAAFAAPFAPGVKRAWIKFATEDEA